MYPCDWNNIWDLLWNAPIEKCMSNHGTKNREQGSQELENVKLADIQVPYSSSFLIMSENVYKKKKGKRGRTGAEMTVTILPSSPSPRHHQPHHQCHRHPHHHLHHHHHRHHHCHHHESVVRLRVRQLPPNAPRRRDQQRWVWCQPREPAPGSVPEQRQEDRLTAELRWKPS